MFSVIPAVALAVANDPTCFEGRSYWVQPHGEAGVYATALQIKATCVPTAAGNLITYLASAGEYANNYDLDVWSPTSQIWNPAWNKVTLDWPNDVDKHYLGGVLHDSPSRSLYHLMQTNAVNTGTLIANGRDGLQAFLNNTNVLGASTVENFNRTGIDDFAFLQQFTPPYMLHISHGCLQETFYDRTVNDNEPPGADLTSRLYVPLTFHGSALGHTIVVYNATVVGDTMHLSGASGLSVSRNTNLRGCDETITVVHKSQGCVDGITRIVDRQSSGSESFPTWATGVLIAVGIVAVIAGGYSMFRKSRAAPKGPNALLM